MQFLTFIRKEFRHIFRDRRTMLILLGIPVVQILLFGFALSTEVRGVRVGVMEASQDDITREIAHRIDASEYFTVTDHIQTREQADEMFRRGRVRLVVAFSGQFADNLPAGGAAVQLIADGSDPNQATMFTTYASQILASYLAEKQAAMNIPLRIEPQIKMLYNPGMKAAYNFVPGVMGLILMLICAMMTSISIVREKEMGTIEVMLVSPMKPIVIILAKAVPYMVLSCVNLATILLLSVFVIGVPVAGSLSLLSLLSVVFILVSLSLGLLISTVASTQIIAMLLSGMVLMMPTVMLSGMIYPCESMPWLLRAISNIIPAKWFIMAVKKVMIEGLGIGAIAKELLILGSMALFLIGVSLKKFKIRLE